LHEAGVRVDDFTPPDLGARSPLALTAADYAAVLATTLTVPELARRLGVDQGWVRRRIARHTLIAVKDGAAWRLPLFQFVDLAQQLVPAWMSWGRVWVSASGSRRALVHAAARGPAE
jgi:excisionase family DNA binding protein